MYQMCSLLFILIFAGTITHNAQGLEVQFKETYPTHFLSSDQDSLLHKRAAEIPQFFDQASFSFDGLARVASVPVPFPLDICILQLPTVKYATALHKDASGGRHFAVYVWRQDEQDYQLLVQLPAPKAVALDCLAFAGRGYVAVSYNLTEPVKLAREGSPVYEISPETGIRAVQYFSGNKMRGMYLRISSQELSLLQAFDLGANAEQQQCPYFKWMGRSFQRLGAIPCSNARRLEAFGIDFTDYVAVANYADAEGRTATHSEIFRYDPKVQRFQLFQRLRSNGAVDVKYFSLPVNEVSKRHFLILGNTIGGQAGEADTVIYVFEKGQFVPYQRLSFYALERFLPVQHSVSEKFLLLVACNKQDVKIYNMNDWRFEESKVQFTEGALSRGVTRMRSYEEAQQSYLVISNENMAANETNIFQPLYKQDEHANILRQEIIDWAREQRKRLERINVQQILKGVQEKFKKWTENLGRSHIKKVTAKLFEDRHAKLSPNYWKALQYAKRALDIIEKDAETTKKRNPSKRSADQLLEEHQFEEITVDTLVVHGTVQAERINGVDTKNPVFESIQAGKVYVSEKYKAPATRITKPPLEQLTVQDLQVKGKLNQLMWRQLQDQTLKRSGRDEQFIKAAIKIDHLQSEAVQVNNNELNNRMLGHLISVDGGDFIVQQDVQFAQPLQVNRLQINQRLNHIHVDRQNFDVLLREANHTQVIDGTKRFENVRVLEPISISGPLTGAQLRAMTPVKVTHQSLQLRGDYVIEGDVTIGRLLQVKDLVDNTTQKSAADTLIRALPLDQPLEDVNVKFLQPITANNTELSFLNAQDLQNLVQLNVDEVQVVQGRKTFPQSVEIARGFGEVKWLNGVDVESLPEMLLTRSGNQTIRVPIQLQGLEIEKVNSTQVTLNGVPLEDYLQVSKDQKSNASLFVNNLDTRTLSLEDLHLNGQIFGQSLSSIYAHGSQSLQSWHLPHDFNGTVHAQNLWLSGNLNQVPADQLEQQLQQLAGNIKYVGDFNFGHAVNISSLSFGNSLNGIPASRFGRCWLTVDGDEEFTAPQELASLESPQGLWLRGQLNNYTLEDLVRRSFRLNGTEHLPAVRFENPIELQSDLQVGLLNGLRVPEDVIYTHQQPGQMLLQPVSIAGDLQASGWCNFSSLNGYPLSALRDYLNTDRVPGTFLAEEVKWQGPPPTYRRLNGHDLRELLDAVWLDNEAIELNGVQVEMANLEGLLEAPSTGYDFHLNGRQVAQIKANYLSKTRGGQGVNCSVRFSPHDVTFKQPPAAKAMELHGLASVGYVIDSSNFSNFSLDFNDFVANSLKTAGVHTVTGQWNLSKASVAGNLSNVLVNQLNLSNDVLRISNNPDYPPPNIEAPKFVSSAVITDLYVTSDGRVANVPVSKWINEAAYIYGNHSIAGLTRLESVNVFNDLGVAGPVNGIHWQPDNLLLRDKNQSLQGSLLVANNLPEEQRIYSNNVENLWVDSVNGLPVNDLLENKAQNTPNLHVESQLIFKQPLTVGHYEVGSDNGLLDEGYKWKRETNAIDLRENVAAVKERLQNPPKVLNNFAVLQKLPHKSARLEILEDALAIWDADTQDTTTYTWQPAQQLFVRNSSEFYFICMRLYISKLRQLPQEWPLQFGRLGFQCLCQPAADKIAIECRDRQNKSRRATIAAREAKQVMVLADTEEMPLLLRTPKAVELWRWSNNSYTFVGSLLDGQQVEHALLVHQEQSSFLALLTSAPAAEITIYSFAKGNVSDLQVEQVLELQQSQLPREMRFWKLPESGDLLLCLSNASPEQPLTIFQHRGASGFQQILGQSSLPQAQQLAAVQVPGSEAELLGLVTEEAVYLLQPQFTKL
ncbi:hypothetical protein KR018_006377 [Drosophila ironensis]|nr:hypothetical protein KR018_006377 [Drosophila ironensis]